MYQVSCDLLDEQSEVRKLKLRQIKAKKVFRLKCHETRVRAGIFTNYQIISAVKTY